MPGTITRAPGAPLQLIFLGKKNPTPLDLVTMLGRAQFTQGAVTSTQELLGQKSPERGEQGEQHLQEPQLLEVKFHPTQQGLEIAEF